MVREDKLKIGFQNAGCSEQLGFLIGKILYIFIYVATMYVSFNSNCLMVQDGNFCGNFGFPINTILAILKSTDRPVAPS